MTKDKKGITLISLAITIIVMLIILGITIVSATVLIDNSRLTKIETQLYLIKGRAEALAEQYAFDEDIKSLISFSKIEETNGKPTVYAYNSSNLSNLKYKSSNNKLIQVKSGDSNFISIIKRIYPSYSELVDSSNNVTINYNKTLDEQGKLTINRILFVKWGLNECISQGVLNSDSKRDKKNGIINDSNKYAIVAYDLKLGELVSVAYSLGHRNDNGMIEYTLDDMLAKDGEED